MLRNIISEREKDLPISTIGEMLRIAAEEKQYISLAAGEPDFGTPNHIIRAAKKCMDLGYTHYSPPGGLSGFKEAVIKKLKKDNKISTRPDNVIVTTGSTEGILLTLMSTIDPGEGAIITDPGFLSYKPTIEVLNGMPISLPLLGEKGFQPDVDKLKKLIIPEKTRVLILNTPGNPTGVVFSKKVLEEIADFAVEYKLIIISDEAYEKLVYDDMKHISIGSLNGMEKHVVTLQSFSKTYAMPGFRLGYAVGPKKLIQAMTKLHIFTSLCAPTISQVAGVEALKASQKCVGKMVKEYDRRRKMITKRLNEIDGFECVRPNGAFYVFPKTHSKMKSLRYSKWLLENAKVAVLPGTEFGTYGEGYIRLSYATDYKLIEKAMDRIEKAVRKKSK